MSKPDFPPIFPPGIHVLSRQQFEAATVTPFKSDARRVRNFQLFSLWLDKVQALGVKGTLWVDGSFVTQKPSPDDIDCILWNPSVPNLPMDPVLQNKVISELNVLFDATVAETQYNLDFYTGNFDPTISGPAPGGKFQNQAYWKGVFGFQHDGVTAKGFVEIHL